MGAFPVGVIQWATCAVIHVAEEGFNEPARTLGMIDLTQVPFRLLPLGWDSEGVNFLHALSQRSLFSIAL